MLDEIPSQFGRVIPIPEVRCSQCGRKTMRIDEKDSEPLCSVCRIHDGAVPRDLADEAVRGLGAARIHEHVIPVEYARHDPRPFGLGFGEIPASKLTQALSEDRRGHGDAYFALFALAGVYVLLGAVVLAIAAVR